MKSAAYTKHPAHAMDDAPSARQPTVTHAADAPRGRLRRWVKSMLGTRDSSLKEVLEEAIEEHEEQSEETLAPEEKSLLHNVIEAGDTKISHVMVPRADIDAVPETVPFDLLKMHILDQRHTRVPVYKDTPDHMLGFIHVKDLLPIFSGDEPFDIRRLLHPLLFVPPSMHIIDLLAKMRKERIHMAIIVDEHGGTDGLVTMENLLEQIVGDVQDEHDEEDDDVIGLHPVGPKAFEADARIPIETVERELKMTFVPAGQSREFDTLGGLIFFKLGRVPARGEVVSHQQGLRFEIVDADPRRIRKVRILLA